jgi:ATP-dependent Lon protease
MISNDDVLNSIEEADKRAPSIPDSMPVLPLRDIVIYPHMIFPVLIGRASTLKAVAQALEREKIVMLVSQKSAHTDDPGFDDLYTHGTVAKIVQVLRLPNNLLKVLVEGVVPARIGKRVQTDPFMEAETELIKVTYDSEDQHLNALVRHGSDLFEEYVKSHRQLPPEVLAAFDNLDDPIRKLYYAAANVSQKVEVKQRVLEAESLNDQYVELIQMLSRELEMFKLETEIDSKVQDQIQRSQRKFFIQEQIRALQTELGEDDDGGAELSALKEQIEAAAMPKAVYEKAIEEFDRLKKTPSMSPEFAVNRTWLELLASTPWSATTEDNLDVNHVRKILDEDHYDLDEPKDRILEYISVLNLVGSMRGQILCFVGPPGVGKTSLARSIARGLGRKFERVSLGGVRDEAEIRGHRRTYIGAMPGKIIQMMKRAGTVNPVILLDEVDKMSMDFRGDPSSALLEVLDPEQNNTFQDHYLEVDYDLSKVLFIATANVMYDIPAPLLDRLEVIQLNSYLEPDKVQIAKRHIVPKLIERHGLGEFKVQITDDALLRLIRGYTREAGVRNLERTIATVLRKLATKIVTDVSSEGRGKKKTVTTSADLKKSAAFKKLKRRIYKVDAANVEDYLRSPRFRDKEEELSDKVGVATGLSWTSVGGDTLPVEVNIMPGAEKLTLTGKLGDVMKESAMAALSFLRSNHERFHLDADFAKGKEIHVHVPEGAIPKDGPSAGITMTLAILSAASGKPLRGDVAMTGEVTLRGNILPIGGLNEKLLAAKRAGITTVLVPEENRSDIKDLNKGVTDGLKLVYVKTIDDAIDTAFKRNGSTGKGRKPAARKSRK